MPFPFPTRTLSSSVADHLEDHNTIATILEQSAFTLSSTRDDHLAHHNLLHPDFGLPSRSIGDAASLHLTDHQTIHPALIETYAGPREAVGQQATTNIPGYPVSFTVDNITTWPTLNNAVNAAGSGRKFHITGSFAFLGVLRPHAGDEFWGANGVTITRAAAISQAIQPTVATAGVKVMNLAFSGFNNGTGSGNGTAADSTIDTLSSNTWEIGYCRFANTYMGTKLGAGNASRVHHCYFDAIGGTFGAFQGTNHIFEDNEFSDCSGDDGQKLVGTAGIVFRHNYCHGNTRSACWFDTHNTQALVEWNHFEDATNVEPEGMGALCFEANTYVENGGGTKISEATKNVARYNRFRNNDRHAIGVYHSSWTEVYGNTFSQDVELDANVGSIDLQDNAPFKGFGNCELKNNSIHNNFVVQTASNRKAVRLNTGTNITDDTPYINNTMNNNFDFNVYDLASTAHTAFRWVDVNKTFAVWQTVPQGSSGTGSFQDINGSEQ